MVPSPGRRTTCAPYPSGYPPNDRRRNLYLRDGPTATPGRRCRGAAADRMSARSTPPAPRARPAQRPPRRRTGRGPTPPTSGVSDLSLDTKSTRSTTVAPEAAVTPCEGPRSPTTDPWAGACRAGPPGEGADRPAAEPQGPRVHARPGGGSRPDTSGRPPVSGHGHCSPQMGAEAPGPRLVTPPPCSLSWPVLRVGGPGRCGTSTSREGGRGPGVRDDVPGQRRWRARMPLGTAGVVSGHRVGAGP